MRPVACVALALLVACSAPAPPVATPTAPPQPTAPPPTAPTSTVLTVPAPVPTASAATAEILTTQQQDQLASARQHMLEANYAAAGQLWRQLLQTGLPPRANADAQYQLVLALAYDGHGADALQVLQQPGVKDDPRAAFATGVALEASDRHAEAMTALAGYASANPAVAPAVWLEVAEKELNAGRARESADAAAKGLDSAQARPLKQRLLEVRSQALAALGDPEGAFDAHRQVLALATSTATLGEQLYRLAQVSRDLGKRDEAVRALQTALDQFPGASTTPDALRLLDELGAADQVDPFILGRARFSAVDYRNAVTAFDRYLQAEPNGPDASAARLYRALASLTPGNEPNALRELDAIADDPNQDSELSAQALVEAGQALEGLNESDQAEVRYQRLLERFPRLDAAATAGFRLGLVRFVRGADADAIAAWDSLIARRDDLDPNDVSRALYWRGKALSRLGRDPDARASWQQAAAVHPSSYYSLRAAALTGQLSDNNQPLADWFASRNLDLRAAASTVASDPALARAQLEANLGLLREGNWEVDEVLTRYPDRPDRLAVLASRFAELGLVGASTQLGQAAMTAASIDAPQDAPNAVRKLAYPRPFAELTTEVSGRYGLDPLLVDTTLEQASKFDAWAEDATSGARGLPAMTPIHADEAASALRAAGADLSRPLVAVEQQGWLLADRLRRFDGRPEVSLTVLSTTERLVDGWLARPGADDPDIFLEQIDFAGVRGAVADALAARIAYGLTYGGSLDAVARVQVKPEPTAAWIKIARLAGDVPPAAPVASAAAVGSAEQQQVFARVATLQRDGDFASAIDALQPLTGVADTNVANAARLRLGQALLAAGRAAEALAQLQPLADADASFLQARALASLGRCPDALPLYQRFIEGAGEPLAAQGQIAGAACLLDMGRADEAIGQLQAAQGTPDLPRLQVIDIRERVALARVRAGDLEGARADYSSLLSAARSDSYRAELNYELGVIAPDPSAAASRFRGAVQLDPKSRAAQSALDELVSLGDPFASSFEAGDTRFEQNRYREALAAYTSFMQGNPSDSRVPKAYYGRGVSLVRLNQDRAGIAVLESIGQRFPNTLDSADGMFRGGRIRESLADLEGAAQSYRTVMAQPNAGSRATDAQFRLAFVQFQQGHFADATAGWRDLVSRVSAADDKAQALFWLGKALAASGDSSGAANAWTSARDTDPRGFYGLRADDLLAGRADPRAALDATAPIVQRHADDDPSADLRAWAASRGDVSSAGARLTSDPSLVRAERLLGLGLRREAIWELGGLTDRLGNDVASLALLGGWEQQHGLYNTALLLGYDIASAARVSLVSGPPAVRKLLYPLPHPSVLAQVGVDPLLFSGLMLQESNMDQDVESAAQARGLSQLIASTAYDAARALGVYGFHSSDLFHPGTSIRLGAFTFGTRVARYDGRIFPALAAYNANQFSVDGWLLAAGEADVDTFAEAIPFTETYPYVQRIYSNYRQYLELYGP